MVFAFESIILLSQISAAPASGLNSGWVNRAWQLEDGLPDSVVSGISQTADGYLWVGTLGGLARFDGIKFKNISLKLESQTVQSMFIDRHDRLWLAMDRGPVLCLAEGTYREFTVADGLRNAPLRHLAEDGEGGLWIASLSAQVSRIKDGRVTSFGQESGVPGRGAASVASDQKGQLWLCKAGDLALFQEGRFQKKFETMDNGALIASARSGGIWVYANSQLYRCGVAEGLEKRASLPLGPRVTPTVMLEDRAGAVWLGTIADGLFYCNDANCDHVPTSHPEITSLAQDREGNIWAGTAGGGLNRLRPKVLELLGCDSGLPFESINSICEDTSNSLWVVTGNGLLARRIGNKWACLSPSNGWADAHATCITADSRGAVWIGTSGAGLFCYKNERFTSFRAANQLANGRVRALLPTSNGDLWLAAFWPTALNRLHEGKWWSVKLPKGDGAIRAMAQDLDGNVWLGTSDGKLMKVSGTNQTVSIERDGDAIRCLWSTPDGSIWIGHAHIGLGLLSAGSYSVISSKAGLFEDAISQILTDDDGWLWVAGKRGIFRVRRQELEYEAAGRTAVVHSVAYGHGEGLANLQANFDFFPGATRSHDGLLWFPMRNGLLEVHPQRIREERKPLDVLLEQVLVDDQPVAQLKDRIPGASPASVIDLRGKGAALSLSPRHHKIEFDFTVLSFIAPDQITFRYRLEGVDEKWVEVGGQRTATYSRLFPGEYKFQVAACNDVGVWKESPNTVTLTVAPFFWQTWWFRLCSIPSSVALVGLGVRSWSNRRLRRRVAFFVQQQALENERVRIARDLHDDLGASLTQIGFAMEELQEASLSDKEVNKQTTLLTERVHTLARDLDAVVWTVNPKNDSLSGLVAYLSQYFLEGFRPTSIRTRLEVDDQFPEITISPDVRHHLFLVAKEAMNNLMKHSEATEAHLKMSASGGIFEITLEDNGRGFSLDAVAASKRHGLRNIKTRTEEVGGTLQILSTLGKGTSVRIRVPLMTDGKS